MPGLGGAVLDFACGYSCPVPHYLLSQVIAEELRMLLHFAVRLRANCLALLSLYCFHGTRIIKQPSHRIGGGLKETMYSKCLAQRLVSTKTEITIIIHPLKASPVSSAKTSFL